MARRYRMRSVGTTHAPGSFDVATDFALDLAPTMRDRGFTVTLTTAGAGVPEVRMAHPEPYGRQFRRRA